MPSADPPEGLPAPNCPFTLKRRGNVRPEASDTGGVRVKIRKLVAPAGIAAVAVVMAAGTAVPASAANDIKPYGVPESLKDVYGNPMIT